MLNRIVDAIAPAADDLLIEIGPGEGALTRVLLERVRRLEAIEIDRDLAARLRAEFPDQRLVVHCGDALQFDFAAFAPGMRLVGNLPYNVSTPLLFHLAGFAERVRDMHFMLQREVVERMGWRAGVCRHPRRPQCCAQDCFAAFIADVCFSLSPINATALPAKRVEHRKAYRPLAVRLSDRRFPSLA